MPPNTPIKLLVYTHSPTLQNDYAQITRHLLTHLTQTKQYIIDIIAINDLGFAPDPRNHPYKIHSLASSPDPDIYKRNYFLDILHGQVPQLQPPWDLVFIFLPPHLLKQPTARHPEGVLASIRALQRDTYMKQDPNHWFKTIGYYPLDEHTTNSDINSVVALTDIITLPSQLALEQVLKYSPGLQNSAHVIYPSVDTSTFKPLTPPKRLDFIDYYFNGHVSPSTFLITTIANNHYLSDLTRTLQIFAAFHQDHPNSFLYLHTDPTGPFVNLLPQAQTLGLEHNHNWSYPSHTDRHLPSKTLSKILASSSVILSTSQGNWWDLSLTQAMACKTLTLAPSLPAVIEQFNALSNPSTHRGLPLQTGTHPSFHVSYGVADANLIRPLVDINHALQQLDQAYQQPQQFKPLIKRAHQWAKSLSTHTINPTWHDLLTAAYHHLTQERQHPHQTLTQIFK